MELYIRDWFTMIFGNLRIIYGYIFKIIFEKQSVGSKALLFSTDGNGTTMVSILFVSSMVIPAYVSTLHSKKHITQSGHIHSFFESLLLIFSGWNIAKQNAYFINVKAVWETLLNSCQILYFTTPMEQECKQWPALTPI